MSTRSRPASYTSYRIRDSPESSSAHLGWDTVNLVSSIRSGTRKPCAESGRSSCSSTAIHSTTSTTADAVPLHLAHADPDAGISRTSGRTALISTVATARTKSQCSWRSSIIFYGSPVDAPEDTEYAVQRTTAYLAHANEPHSQCTICIDAGSRDSGAQSSTYVSDGPTTASRAKTTYRHLPRSQCTAEPSPASSPSPSCRPSPCTSASRASSCSSSSADRRQRIARLPILHDRSSTATAWRDRGLDSKVGAIRPPVPRELD